MKMAFGQWARGTCQWAASQNGCGGRSHLWKRNWGFWRRLLESCASLECGVWVGVGGEFDCGVQGESGDRDERRLKQKSTWRWSYKYSSAA